MHYFLLLLLACGEASGPAASPTAPPPAPSSASPTPPAATAAPAGSTVPLAADAASFGGKWLVITASNREPGQVPAAVAALIGTPEGDAFVRLDSSRYKGLMPCYDVIIGGAYDKRADALARVTALKAAGVDAYAKPAGVYVGADARVEAYCRGVDAPHACPERVRFVERWGDASYAYLGLDSALVERALANVAAPTPITTQKDAWRSPLAARSLDGLDVGASLPVVRPDGHSSSCAVTGFVALTRGIPHFGWAEHSDGKSPGCGEPALFAQLDCDAPTGSLAGAPGSAAPLVGQMRHVRTDGPAKRLANTGAFAAVRAEVQAHAAAQGAPVDESLIAREVVIGGRTLTQVDLRWSTGEGWVQCGGDDIVGQLVGVLDGDAVVVPYQRVEALQDAQVVQAPSGALWIEQTSFPIGRGLFDATGAPLCHLAVAFCDCGC